MDMLRPEKHIEGVMPELHLTVGVRADTNRMDLDFVADSSTDINWEMLFGFLRSNILVSNYIN